MSNQPTKLAQFVTDVAALLRSRSPLLEVVTTEESRAEQHLAQAIARAGFEPHFWDMASGCSALDGTPELDMAPVGPNGSDPDKLLTNIGNREGTADKPRRDVWILRDFPQWWDGPSPAAMTTLRRVRNLARPDGLPSKPGYSAQAIIVLTPTLAVPEQLSNHTTVLELPLPDRAEIAELLDDAVDSAVENIMASGKVKLSEAMVRAKIRNGSTDAAISAAVGLSGEEAQATFAKSLAQHRRVDPATISAEKKRIISRSGLLEWVDTRPGGFANVGGVDELKAHVLSSAQAYSPEARAYGLPTPKGIFLMGVSGCGKSELAKAIPSELGIPLIRMDLGKLKSKFVGDSEQNLRSALATIDAIGACELWVDEVEKGLQGATSGSADGGVSADAMGTILTWMQERDGGAYVVFTANDVSDLPPELMRKGRFDEVFWIDLPTQTERAAIVAATLPKFPKQDGTTRTADSLGIDLDAVADATGRDGGFTGAEVANLVVDALRIAFTDGQREPTTDDLVAAAKVVRPMAETQAKKLTELRAKWATTTRRASSEAPARAKGPAKRATRQIDM
jgi:SpoVK/Ycf46/Vps4 family AAA+-type ATPase